MTRRAGFISSRHPAVMSTSPRRCRALAEGMAIPIRTTVIQHRDQRRRRHTKHGSLLWWGLPRQCRSGLGPGRLTYVVAQRHCHWNATVPVFVELEVAVPHLRPAGW
jgi:hypothetical protein